jgi:hypothetical protein
VVGEWVEADVAAGSPLHKVANATRDRTHPGTHEHAGAVARVRDYLGECARAAGAADPDRLAAELQLLTHGAVAESANHGSIEPWHIASGAAVTLIAAATSG